MSDESDDNVNRLAAQLEVVVGTLELVTDSMESRTYSNEITRCLEDVRSYLADAAIELAAQLKKAVTHPS